MSSLKFSKDQSPSTITIVRDADGISTVESGPVGVTHSLTFMRRIKLHRYSRLEMFLVCVALLLLVSLVVVILVLDENNHSKETNSKPRENYKKTVNNIARVLAYMDDSVDSCKDFYQFSCGGWEKNNYIKDSKAYVFPFLQVLQKNKRQLKNILENEEIKAQYSKSPFMVKLFQFYSSCKDSKTIDKFGESHVKDLLVELADFDLTKKRNSSYDWPDVVVKIKRQLNIDAFFKLRVLDDLSNPTFKRIVTFPLQLPSSIILLGSKSKKEENLERYVEFMTEVMYLISSSDNRTYIKQEMRKVCELEVAIGKSQYPPNLKGITIKNLSNKTKFDWLKFFHSLSKDGGYILTRDELLITSAKMLHSILGVLNKIEASTIANYLSWRIVYELINILPSKFVRLFEEYKSVKIHRWDMCVQHTSYAFPLETALLYGQRVLPKGTQDEATNLLQDVMDVFLGLIPKQSWMDQRTRDKALLKAKSMLYDIGYPENLTMILSKEGLRDFAIDVNYVKTYRNMIRFVVLKEIKSLKTVKNRNTFMKREPLKPNAYYYRTYNKIEMAISLLENTFFSIKNYKAANFATLGMIFAHEINHGFDIQGSRYDEVGNVGKLLSKDSSNYIYQKHLCLKDLYNNFTHNSEKIRSVINHREQFCDAAGVEIAFQAYQRWKKQNTEEEMLPGIKLTHDQLFFVSYAQMWCAKYKDSELKRMLTKGSYPFPLRVQGTMMNSKGFADAFSCVPDAPMIPHKRCEIWET